MEKEDKEVEIKIIAVIYARPSFEDNHDFSLQVPILIFLPFGLFLSFILALIFVF